MIRGTDFTYDVIDTPCGPCWLVTSSGGLSFLVWKRSKEAFLAEIQNRVGRMKEGRSIMLDRWHDALVRYFNGERVCLDGPISLLVGTPFQQKVWVKLKEIPYGETRSYQWVSNQLGMARGARAIGSACRENPLPVIFPCHRVVRQDGALGGYSGGVYIKKMLLGTEHGDTGRKP